MGNLPKIPSSPFLAQSKKSADKMARDSASRVKKWSKGKSYR